MIDESWYKKPKKIKERTSAGGIIMRKEGKKLLIALARDKEQPDYILPKGGVDKGETLLQAAKREIEEEAGFKKLKKIEKLAVLGRLNYSKTRWITTHYFLFQTNEVDVKPTETERHAKPHWFLLDELPTLFWPEQKTLILENTAKIKSLLKLK